MRNNVEFLRGSIKDVLTTTDKKIQGVRVSNSVYGHEEQHSVYAPALVLAVGPYLKDFGHKLNVDFPVMNELHSRVEIKDPKNLIPEGLPFMIWSDDIKLPWSAQEIQLLKEKKSPDIADLLNPFTVSGIAGAHLRPLSSSECNHDR